MYPFPDTNRSIPSTGALFSFGAGLLGNKISSGNYTWLLFLHFVCLQENYSIVRLEIETDYSGQLLVLMQHTCTSI